MNKEKPEKSVSDARTARLGAALRANLRRRKAQSRAKATNDPEKSGDDADNAALQTNSDQ